MQGGYSVASLLRVPSCRSGFTLIEIAVVLAIIGMVALLVLPRLPSTESGNLKTSAATLAATIRYAQDRSASGKTAYFLQIEPGTDRVRILEAAADGTGREPADPLLRKRPLMAGIQVADVMVPRLGKVSDGQLRLDVAVGGVRDFTVMHLKSADNSFWTVMAFPAGGKVKLYQGYQEEPL